MGALSVTWDPKYREPFLPLLDSEHVPFNNVDKLDAAITEETGGSARSGSGGGRRLCR